MDNLYILDIESINAEKQLFEEFCMMEGLLLP